MAARPSRVEVARRTGSPKSEITSVKGFVLESSFPFSHPQHPPWALEGQAVTLQGPVLHTALRMPRATLPSHVLSGETGNPGCAPIFHRFEHLHVTQQQSPSLSSNCQVHPCTSLPADWQGTLGFLGPTAGQQV